MKSDLSKFICPKQLAEALCNIMGLDQIADLVNTDIFLIFLDVGPAAKSAVLRLLFLERQQPRFHKRNKRQRSHEREQDVRARLIILERNVRVNGKYEISVRVIGQKLGEVSYGIQGEAKGKKSGSKSHSGSTC